jgi:adenosylcobinamide kinase/adenosylcobinamide-phosphate guanylyltransferase
MNWRLVETARAGAPTLSSIAFAAASSETLLVDSLGTWLGEVISLRLAVAGEAGALDGPSLEEEMNEAVDALAATRGCAIVVGDEVGWGLVPPFPSGRIFRDVLGRAQQRLAARSERAYLVVAGFALDLRAAGESVD